MKVYRWVQHNFEFTAYSAATVAALSLAVVTALRWGR